MEKRIEKTGTRRVEKKIYREDILRFLGHPEISRQASAVIFYKQKLLVVFLGSLN